MVSRTARPPVVPTGVVLPKMAPGSPEWLKVMSASKVPAMLGVSPYDSPFSLWHLMAGHVTGEPESDVMRRGHYLEPALLSWFTDRHIEVSVSIGASFRHVDRAWQTAAPDGLVWTRGLQPKVTALLECKTALNDWEWGAPGTDEIPVYHRAQVQWQMDTTGVHRTYVAMLTTHFEFREYVVDYDPDDAAWIREQAKDFMASIAAGEEPDIDSTDHTYRALRQLHPLIDGTECELPPDVAIEFLHTYRQKKAAEKAHAAARNRVAQAMGTASVGKFADTPYANRQTRSGNAPFVVIARGLTDKEDIAS